MPYDRYGEWYDLEDNSGEEYNYTGQYALPAQSGSYGYAVPSWESGNNWEFLNNYPASKPALKTSSASGSGSHPKYSEEYLNSKSASGGVTVGFFPGTGGSRSAPSTPKTPPAALGGFSSPTVESTTWTWPTTNIQETVTSGTTTTLPSTRTSITSPSSSTTIINPQEVTQTSSGVSTTTHRPTMALPVFKEVPALEAPVRDRMRERVLAQEEAALGVGEWRQSLRSGLNKIMSEGNFASRGAQMRQLFEGAGHALGRILQSAGKIAREAYQAEYNALFTAAVQNYQGAIQQRLAAFQADVQMYLGTMDTSTSTSGTQSTSTTGGGSTTTNTGGQTTETISGGGSTTTGTSTTTGSTSGGVQTTNTTTSTGGGGAIPSPHTNPFGLGR